MLHWLSTYIAKKNLNILVIYQDKSLLKHKIRQKYEKTRKIYLIYLCFHEEHSDWWMTK
jgi:hypothetical protein